MLLVKLLLCCCKVAIRVVVNAIYIAISTLASRSRKCKRPTVIELTCCVRHDSTEIVHLVTTRHTCTEALTHLRCTSVDVGCTAKTAYTVVGSCQTCGGLLVAGCVVHTAPQRPRAITSQSVVETNTIEIYIGVLRIVTTHIEAHLAKTIRGYIVVEILRSRKGRWQSLCIRCRRVVVQLGKDCIVEHLARNSLRHYDYSVDILNAILDLNHNIEILELGSSKREFVVTCWHTLQLEVTIIVGLCLVGCTLNRYRNISDSSSAVARQHPTLQSALLCKGGRGKHCHRCNK